MSGLADKVSIGTQRLDLYLLPLGSRWPPYHGKALSSLFVNADMGLVCVQRKAAAACSDAFFRRHADDIRNEKAPGAASASGRFCSGNLAGGIQPIC